MDEDLGLVSEGTMFDDSVPDTPLEIEFPSLDSLNPYVQPSQCSENGLQLTSPVKTLETVETIVSTNKVSVYSTVEPPRVGMVFKRWQDIESYYKEYAEQSGFGVTRQSGSFTKEKERRAIYWRCECWGPPDMRARREARKREKAMEVCGTGAVVNGEIGENELVRGKRTSKKCECEARIYASVNRDGDWVLKTVVLDHVHTLDPSGAKLVKEYRMKNYTSSVKKQLMDYYEEGVPVKQIHGCMATELGGEENLPTVQDLQHEVQKERRLKMEGGDAAAMMTYFDRMQADNQNFYHAHRLDEEGRLKDVFWVDARSRVAYEEFGDVVCFDATYLTNEYELPFANFVGVNHHGQSLLLGCALVSHENCDTFLWVFQQWLACMGNKPPGAILTDQAPAMRRPLQSVMPSTRHRWCIWHILRKIPEKLGKCENYEDFKSPLKTLIYESFTVEEFETRWHGFMAQWKLEENDWLCDLFEERHMWVPAFMKDYFWAGMKTTQRVESINSFFDGFVNRQTKLHEFPEKYKRAMERRVKSELDADARCGKYVRRLVSGFKVEKLFQKIYTDAKFQELQKECARMGYCVPNERRDIGNNKTEYVLEDRVWIIPEGKSEDVITDRYRSVHVTFDHETKDVSCECRKFETFGILCKHVIRVFELNRVFDIPSKYILDRWRKDVPRKHTRVKVAYHDPEETPQVQYHRRMMREFEGICDEAAAVDDIDTVDLVLSSLKQLRLDVKESRSAFLKKQAELPVIPGSQKGSNTLATKTPTSTAKKPVKDPVARKKPRGRPKTTRYKTLAENGYKTQKTDSTTVQKTSQTTKTITQTRQGKRKRATRPLSALYEDCVDPDLVEHQTDTEDSHSYEI